MLNGYIKTEFLNIFYATQGDPARKKEKNPKTETGTKERIVKKDIVQERSLFRGESEMLYKKMKTRS